MLFASPQPTSDGTSSYMRRLLLMLLLLVGGLVNGAWAVIS